MKQTIRLLLFLFCFTCTKCTQKNIDITHIDTNGIDNKGPLKIVLSKFEFTSITGWQWIKLDSITTTDHVVSWPKKYNTPFNASLTIYNSKNVTVGFAPDFIFSNYGVSIKKNNDPKLYNYIFKAEGGENELFENKNFLSPPPFKKPADFRTRIKNEGEVAFSDPVFTAKWQAYERDVLNSVKNGPGTYYTLLRLMQNCDALSNFTLTRCYEALAPNLKITGEANYIKNYLKNSQKLYAGNKLFNFTVLNEDGREIAVNKSLNKKYYFMDFWASWCGGCRTQMQQLKQVYSTVDTNKLQFMSLSVDTKKELWAKACNQEKLRWLSYVQSGDKSQNLFNLFSLMSIPSNVLIDSEGKIVCKDISIVDLDKLIETKQLAIIRKKAPAN